MSTNSGKSYKAFVQQDHLQKTDQHLYENKYSFTSIKQSVINTIHILEYNTIKLCLSIDTQQFSLLYKKMISQFSMNHYDTMLHTFQDRGSSQS